MAKYTDELELIDRCTQTLEKINKKFDETDKKSNKVKKDIQDNDNGFKKFSKSVGVAVNALKVLASAMVIKQAVQLTQQIADVGDRIDKTSQKIGMSRKAFQEWDYIMSQNGGSVDSLQMGFKTLTTQMENVQKGSKDSIKAFQALGVSVKDNKGKFRSQDEVFKDTIRSLQKIKDPTKKAMLANRLFGRSAVELRPLLNQEAEAVDELRNKANKLGLIISDEDIDNSVKFKDTMDTLGRVFSTKFQSTVMKTFPAMTQLMEAITPVANEVGESWSKSWQRMKAENGSFFQALETSWNWFINTGIPNIGISLGWLGDAITNVFTTANYLLGQVGAKFGNDIGMIIGLATDVQIAFTNIFTKIQIAFINFQKRFIAFINAIKSALSSLGGVSFNFAGTLAKIGANAISGGSSVTNSSVVNNNQVSNTTNNTYNYGVSALGNLGYYAT